MTAAPYAHFPPATAPSSAPEGYGGLTVQDIPRHPAEPEFLPCLADGWAGWREDWRQALLWEADPCP